MGQETYLIFDWALSMNNSLQVRNWNIDVPTEHIHTKQQLN